MTDIFYYTNSRIDNRIVHTVPTIWFLIFVQPAGWALWQAVLKNHMTNLNASVIHFLPTLSFLPHHHPPSPPSVDTALFHHVTITAPHLVKGCGWPACTMSLPCHYCWQPTCHVRHCPQCCHVGTGNNACCRMPTKRVVRRRVEGAKTQWEWEERGMKGRDGPKWQHQWWDRDGDEGKCEGQEDTCSINEGQCATHTLPLLSSITLSMTRWHESHMPPHLFPPPSVMMEGQCDTHTPPFILLHLPPNRGGFCFPAAFTAGAAWNWHATPHFASFTPPTTGGVSPVASTTTMGSVRVACRPICSFLSPQ